MYHLKFDETSNAQAWIDSFQVLGEDGAVSDILADGWTVTVKIAALPPQSRNSWDYGALNTSAILTASSADGTVVIGDTDAMQWTFTADQMGQLGPGPYLIGGLATKASFPTTQLFLGTLPVIQGL